MVEAVIPINTRSQPVDCRSGIANPRCRHRESESSCLNCSARIGQGVMARESKMLRARILLPLAIALAVANGQDRYYDNFYTVKPGSCPPPTPVEICTRSCYADGHCQGIGKCCPTSCGGTICSRPVTMRTFQNIQKPGSCPAVPTGRWVCSSTCSIDTDCRGTKKCCKNRCGAMACQKPDIEVIESIEIPFGVRPEITSNDVPNRNPFLNYN